MQASFLHGSISVPTGVKNRPFQAQYENTHTKKLPSGKISQQIKMGNVYRATDGRSRRDEQSREAIDKFITVVIIHNPSKHEGYLLDVESKTVFVMPIPETHNNSADNEPKEHLSHLSFTGEEIGSKKIEDLTCRGFRIKRGDSVTEYWVSEDLLEILLVKEWGADEENTLRLFNVNRIEPANDLFTVPVDYKELNIGN